MPSALLHAIVSVAFLAIYALAGEVIVAARRRRRDRQRQLTLDTALPHFHWRCEKSGRATVSSRA